MASVHMLTITSKKLKILWPTIKAVAIYVMNNFAFLQAATNHRLHDETVNHNAFVPDCYRRVAALPEPHFCWKGYSSPSTNFLFLTGRKKPPARHEGIIEIFAGRPTPIMKSAKTARLMRPIAMFCLANRTPAALFSNGALLEPMKFATRTWKDNSILAVPGSALILLPRSPNSHVMISAKANTERWPLALLTACHMRSIAQTGVM